MLHYHNFLILQIVSACRIVTIHLKEMRHEDGARAVALNNDGRSLCYIANALNMPRSTVHDAIKR